MIVDIVFRRAPLGCFVGGPFGGRLGWERAPRTYAVSVPGRCSLERTSSGRPRVLQLSEHEWRVLERSLLVPLYAASAFSLYMTSGESDRCGTDHFAIRFLAPFNSVCGIHFQIKFYTVPSKISGVFIFYCLFFLSSYDFSYCSPLFIYLFDYFYILV